MIYRYYLVPVLLFAGMAASCGGKGASAPNILTADTEPQIRSLLGIPTTAKQVMIVSQSSHWDIDWRTTFDGYFYKGYLGDSVNDIIKQALDMLDTYPGYYYSICEIAFLQKYWEVHPEDHARIIKYLENGHLRIVGGGMTSPDTNLPTGESLIMDWLYGNLWVGDLAGIKPVTAWQPDSFGHAQSLPDILASLGYKYVGFTRVPGNSSMSQWLGSAPVTPNSFAALLFSTGSIDFVWKGTGGATVLAHFVPGSYGEGDALYSGGTNQAYINGVLSGLISQLKPVSPTGYMFLPVGKDFMPPDQYLPEQVAGWDATMFTSTGVYITLATFEDYMKLVSFHTDKLPTYAVDLNPYFTGYYGTRPKLKKLARETTYALTSAQLYSVIASLAGYTYPAGTFTDVWEPFLRSDHHDFIPGTSADSVYYTEQVPLLQTSFTGATLLQQSATTYIAGKIDTSGISGDPIIVFNPSGYARTDLAQAELSFTGPGTTSIGILDQSGSTVTAQIITSATFPDGSLRNATVEFYADGVPALGYATYTAVSHSSPPISGVGMTTDAIGDVILTNPYERLVLGKDAGYAMTSLVDSASSREMLSGPSNDIVYYDDTGDPWEIGSEPAAGGVFQREYALSQTTSSYTVTAQGPLFTTISVQTQGPYGTVTRTYTVYTDLRRIDLSTTMSVPDNTTSVAAFSTTITDGIDRMAIPYGIIQRPFTSLYTPQFWPGVEWVDLLDPAQGDTGMAVFDLGNEMWSFNSAGRILMGLVRNAFASCSAMGQCSSDPDVHTSVYALMPHVGGDFFTQDGYAFSAPLTAVVTSVHTGTLPPAYSLASVTDNAMITDVKLSMDQRGIVLRLFRLTPGPAQVTVNYAGHHAGSALITDSYEVPIGRPTVSGQDIGLDMTGTIATLLIPLK